MKHYTNYLYSTLVDATAKQKIAVRILSRWDISGYLQEWYTKWEIIRRWYPSIKDELGIDTKEARILLEYAFDTIQKYNYYRKLVSDYIFEWEDDPTLDATLTTVDLWFCKMDDENNSGLWTTIVCNHLTDEEDDIGIFFYNRKINADIFLEYIEDYNIDGITSTLVRCINKKEKIESFLPSD